MLRSLRGRRPTLRAAAGAVLTAAITFVAATFAQAADLPEGWLQDFDQAKAKAAETKKPIMAVFSASWCGPCQHMVKNVYPTTEVITELGKWVPVYIDGDENETITKDMKVRGYPTYVLMDSAGVETYRIVGASPDSSAFLAALNKGVEFGTKSEPFRARLASNPKDAEAMRSIGALHVEADQADMAEEYFFNALEIDPKTTTGIPARVVKKAEKVNAGKATRARLDKAIEADPKDAAALAERGHFVLASVLKDGDAAVESARADFAAAAEVAPENPSVKEGADYLAMLDILFTSGEPDTEALDTFRASHPKSAHLETLLALDVFIAMSTEQMVKAAAFCESYLATYPDGYMIEEMTGMLEQLRGAVEMQRQLEAGEAQIDLEVIEEEPATEAK